jgi:hypothetical protein
MAAGMTSANLWVAPNADPAGLLAAGLVDKHMEPDVMLAIWLRSHSRDPSGGT